MKKKTMFINLICCIGIVAGVILRFSKLITGEYTLATHNSDLTDLLFPYIVSCARTVSNGELPLFCREILGGQPMAGYPQLGALYPVNLLIWSLFNQTEEIPFVLFDSMIVVHAVIAGFGAFYMLRKIGFNRIVCFVGAMIYCTCPSFLASRQWIHHFSGYAWWPLFMGLAIQICNVKEWKKAFGPIGCAALVCGMMIMAAPCQAAIMGIFLVGCYGLYRMILSRDIKYALQVFSRLMISVCLGVMLASVTLLPVANYMMNSYRFTSTGVVDAMKGFPYEEFIAHGLNVESLTSFLITDGRADPMIAVGMCAGILSIMDLFRNRSYAHLSTVHTINFSRIVLVSSLLLTVGVALPILLYPIPVINMVRELFLFSWYLPLSVSILSADMLQHFVDTYELLSVEYKHNRYGSLALLAVAIYGLFYMYSYKILIWRFVIIVIFIGIIGYGIPWLIKRSEKLKNTCCKVMPIILCMSLLLLYGRNILVDTPMVYSPIDDTTNGISYYYEGTRELTEYLKEKQQDDLFRIFPQYSEDTPIGHGTGAVMGFESTFGYSNPVPIATMECYWRLPLNRYCDLLNARYLLSNAPLEEMWHMDDTNAFALVETFKDTISATKTVNDCLVYENIERPGYAYCVDKYLYYYTDEEAWSMLQDPSIDLALTGIISGEYNGLLVSNASELESSVKTVSRTSNAARFRVEVNQPCILVISEFYDTDWQFKINGDRVAPMKVNNVLVGLSLQKGCFEIEMNYQPKSFTMGIQLAMVGCIGVLSLLTAALWNRMKQEERQI